MKTLNVCIFKTHTRRTSARSFAGLFAALFSAVLLGGISVQAGTTYYWTNAVPDNYTNPLAWSPNGVPGFLDTAIVGNATNSSETVLYTNVLSDPLSTNRVYLFQMGVGAAGTGTFNMTDGVLLITNGMAVPFTNGGSAFQLGLFSGAVDTFSQSGGTLVVARPSASSLYYQDGFLPGQAAGANGTYSISGGLADILCGVEIGVSGSGAITISGGTVIDNGWFGVRGGSTSSDSGTFNLSGGSLYILRNPGNDGASAAGGVSLAQTGSNAVANVSGGTLYCTQIRFNTLASANETLNISGGNLYIGYIGLYRAGAALSQNITISGGTFHTADMVPVSASTVGSTNTVLSDGTNWTWNASLPVNLTNNTFLVNGQSGPGYVTFAPEANRTITLANQWTGVGGMTMSGPGTLTLNAANTFGALTVNGGTLALGAAQTDNGGLTFNGGIVQFNAGGSLIDPTIATPSGGSVVFNEGGQVSFTNIVTGAGNVLVNNGNTTVNVANNLQNSGAIVINAGALVVNGSILNSSGITNNSSTGPLVAQGTILSPITINTNALYVGTTTACGTLNASNVTLNAGATFVAKINTDTTPGGGTNDLLVATNIVLDPNSFLTIEPLTAPSLGTYVIARYSGTRTGTFGGITNNTLDTMHLDYTTPGEIDLVVDSVNTASLIWSAPPIGTNYISWDVNTSTNWINAGVLDKFQQLDSVTFNNLPGTTNRVAVQATVLPSSITITGNEPYIFSGTGKISGGGSLTYDDTNTSGMYIANGNDFTGPVYIRNGILQDGTGGVSPLGMGANYIYSTNNGTLDLNDISPGSKTIVIAGSGYNSNGALADFSTSTAVHYCVTNLALAGDATIGASGRWDFPSSGVNDLGGTLTGNGFDLTKVGPGQVTISPSGGTGLGNIDIQAGTLTFGPHVTDFGDPTKTITVESGTSLYFYGTPALASKFLTLDDGSTLLSGLTSPESAPQFIGPVTLFGNSTINTILADMTFSNVISGTGGFTKIGASNLWLYATNTYSGPTLVNAGSIVLGPTASIADSSLIQLATNTTLDVIAPGSLDLGSGQTLAGIGSVFGDVSAGAGTTLSPGSGRTPGTLTFTNNLTLNGDTNFIKLGNDASQVGKGVNDLLLVNNTLTLSGVSTINVFPLGSLDTTQPYTVMQAGSISGDISHLTVFNNHTRFSLAPSISRNNVQVTITGSANHLLWTGANSADWDLVTSNWMNLDTASADKFYNEDSPIFDDSSTATNVNIPADVIPAGIFMSNVNNTYTFSGGGVISGALNMEGNGSGKGGTLILAMSNAPAFEAIDSAYGTLVFALRGLTNYVINTPIGDNEFTYAGKIIFGGTNTAVLTADNAGQGFDGIFMVTNGVLQYTVADALGLTSQPFIITNSGTLDFNGVPVPDTLTLHISGNGFNGQGALTDSKSTADSSGGTGGAFTYLTLDGDASVGAPGAFRWDQNNPTGTGAGQVNGNGYKLTKVGSGAVVIYGQADGDTHLGDIDVAAGRLIFQCNANQTLSLGQAYPNNVLSVESNAVCTFYDLTNSLDQLGHGGVNKVMWLKGDAGFDSATSPWTNNFDGPVFLTGTNFFITRSTLYMWNDIMDSNAPGGFVLGTDAGLNSSLPLYLEGTNSYSGPTIISNATVVVGANSSLGLTSLIQINSGAKLDLSALSSFNFGTTATNQTMIGNGTVVGPTSGNINFNSGSTLAVGFPDANTYTLTMNGNLVFNTGSTNIVKVNKTAGVANDEVVGLTSVTLGGTLVVTNVGANPLVAGDVIKLFNAATYSGLIANIIPAHPNGDSSLSWDLGQLDVNGTVGVFVGSGIGAATLAPTNLTLYVGQTYTYSAVAQGTPPFYYQWYHGASPVLNATNSTFPAVAALGTDVYSFVATNNFGSVTSNPAMLTGIIPPTNHLYPATVLSNNPVAYWRLDETTGTIAHDYAGGHNGSYTNAQQGVPGYNPTVDPDYAALFGTNTLLMTMYPSNSYVGEIDGSSVGVPNINFSQPNGSNAEFSVEAWVNGGASQIVGAGIVTKGYGNGGEQFAIDAHTGFRFYVRNTTGTSYPAQSTVLPDGNWHHLVGVCDEASGLVHLYVDGVDVADDAIPAGSGLLAAPADAALPAASLVSIGARTSNGTITNFNLQFTGTIDEVAIYNYALSATQVTNDYQAGISSGISINPNPTNIVFSVTGGTNLVLSWPQDHTGWRLQAQTNSLSVGIYTNWSDVSGSTTTNQVIIPINLTNGCVFYRLVYP